MLKIFLAAATAGAFVAGSYLPASAHDDGRVDARQERQAAAIERGRISGKITWREGLKLRAEQRRIAKLEHEFRKNDGDLDRHEKAVLLKMLDTARKSIRAEKRDGHKRFSALPRFGR